MTKSVFMQDLKKGEIHPGGPFIIELLFKEQAAMPEKDWMTQVIQRWIGRVECFCCDEQTAGFAALDHPVEFEDGKAVVQLMITRCTQYDAGRPDPFVLSQMWDCEEERDKIFNECRWHAFAVDMLGSALPARERAELLMDFVEALAEVHPSCDAFFFKTSGKLFTADQVRGHGLAGLDRFIRFGVNARFFTVQGTDDMIVDTLGMSVLNLPDLQYHFHGLDPNLVVGHAYSTASYILENDDPIKDGETISGIEGGEMNPDVKWRCRYEEALIQPARTVLDVEPGDFASGGR